jgi:ADP-heptose:LPS heptosyltransferase
MRIVVLHAGGLGDLVLVESLLSALRERHAGARVELACRADVAPVTALYAQAADAVHTFAFNPYRWAVPDDAAARQAQTLLPKLRGKPVDLFVSAELRPTWLGEILAAALAPRAAAIGNDRRLVANDVLILLGKLGLPRNAAVRRLGTLAGEHELDRYARLAGAPSRRAPALRAQAGSASSDVMVFPFGASELQQWPMAAMGEAALRIAAPRRARIVVVAADAQRREADAAVGAGTFGDAPELLLGSPGDLPAVAERIAASIGYVGIDTGLAHLAAAYGVPGVTVFGGGYWPSYAPWAPHAAGVVAPIPCFGCEWDCAFGRPFCIEGVDVASVVAAFEDVCAHERTEPLVRLLDPYGAREKAVFDAAGRVHRAAQDDRAARLAAITRLRNLFVRFARRSRAARRRADAALTALADRTIRTARRLESAAPAKGAAATTNDEHGPVANR